jgi:hypothetical protein
MGNDLENREALRERKLPQMQLCSGSSGLPLCLPTSSDHLDAAKSRFAVRGNAVGALDIPSSLRLRAKPTEKLQEEQGHWL